MPESHWTAKTTAITAIVGVPIAILAIVVPVLVNHHDAPAASPPTATPTTATAPAGSTPSKTRAAAPSGGALLGTYSDIELTSFHAVDLDVDPPKVVDYSPLEFLETIGTNTGDLVTSDYELVLLPPGAPASYAQCHAATRYTYDIHLDQIVNGSQICATTNHHRLARLTVTHAPADEDGPQYIAFNATVWQTPLS